MMTLNRRNLVWLIPALLLVSFPLWRLPVSAFLSPRGIEENAAEPGTENQQNFVMQQVIIIQNQAGKKTAEIKAHQAYTSDKPDEFVLIDVDADMFDEQGDLINIRAESGIYDTKTKHLILNKKVVVNRVSQNQRLYTDLLHYYEDKRLIDSPLPTRMVADQVEINGSSFKYDILTGQYLIGGRVYCLLGSE